MQLTTNYGLKKPEANEYYNVEDFNENADRVDTELKRIDDSLGSHAVRQYTALSQIGLSDDDMDTADAKANLYAIYGEMPAYSELWLIAYADVNPNFWNSMYSKWETDIGESPDDKIMLLKLVKTPYVLEVYLTMQGYPSTARVDYREFGCMLRVSSSGASASLLSAFTVIRDPNGFVTKAGGILFGAKLALSDGNMAWLHTASDLLQLSHYAVTGDTSNAAHILLAHPKHATRGGLGNVLRLAYTLDGVESYYPIVHAGGGMTMKGSLVAHNDTDYSTYKIRNAAILDAIPSSMSNGTVAFVYK